ncbi:Beta-galactosidase 10 [Linum perenne]
MGKLLFFAICCFLLCFEVGLAGNVTYDGRSLIIDGQRKFIISASIHYPRSVPAMWPGLVQTAKEGGADTIETYVFWNGHEIAPSVYNFEGRYDLVKFVKIVQEAGLYLILRIGPVVAAEWNYGGVPVWLHYIPGTVFRTDNENFKVENEYGFYEPSYGEGGKKYAMWAANMAVAQNTGVPWIMCQQFDAPDTVINTCNDFYCDGFRPLSPNMPKIWTENWTGWFQYFGGLNPHRPTEDLAFSVALFFQKGGSVNNYYMYHGGTNFGRTSGGPFITTSYDYDAPIDEYGLPRLQKWGHLKELHKAIKLCENVLATIQPNSISLGPSQEADIYADASGACCAFLANSDAQNDMTVVFWNSSYYLPAWSVSILSDCKNEVFNTAKVASQSSVVEMVPEDLRPSTKLSEEYPKTLEWEVFVEKAGIWGEADLVKNSLEDHINTTKDASDYLCITISDDEQFLKRGQPPVLMISSNGHALHVYVNGQLQGSASGNNAFVSFEYKETVTLKAGKNEISLLSMAVGLKSAGSLYEWTPAGLTSVKIEGLNNGTMDLSTYEWTYKIGLQGEKLAIHTSGGMNSVNWIATPKVPKMQPLTWYKMIVDPPTGDEPIGLDMLNMGKGLAWLNGEEIGRYWLWKSPKDNRCAEECDYRGALYLTSGPMAEFMLHKCSTGCGEPTQRWYHIPRSWFKPSDNILVIFEERGGDPTTIKFSKRRTSGVCASVGEDYPSGTLHLECPKEAYISSVKFASFGTPTGTCGSYKTGDCHDLNSIYVVEKVSPMQRREQPFVLPGHSSLDGNEPINLSPLQECLNRNECSIQVSEEKFSLRNCSAGSAMRKRLAVEVVCSSS